MNILKNHEIEGFDIELLKSAVLVQLIVNSDLGINLALREKNTYWFVKDVTVDELTLICKSGTELKFKPSDFKRSFGFEGYPEYELKILVSEEIYTRYDNKKFKCLKYSTDDCKRELR